MKNKRKSATERFEELVANRSKHYVFRLYIAGTKRNSARALTMIKDFCEKHLAGRYDLQVIDIFQTPDCAKSDNIVVVPTLVRIQPNPVRRLVGDLSKKELVLRDLIFEINRG